jgi:hypothetical protein
MVQRKEGHLKEGRSYTTAIHKFLTLELLYRLFFDAQMTLQTSLSRN